MVVRSLGFTSRRYARRRGSSTAPVPRARGLSALRRCAVASIARVHRGAWTMTPAVGCEPEDPSTRSGQAPSSSALADGDLVASPPKVEGPADVADAVRTLIRWAGDDPDREGLLDTPNRVARAWREYAAGYADDPAMHLARTFEEVGGYDEIVLLKDIPFQSHCEHHMAPIIGKASIAYLPRDKVVGISKLARVLHGFARRLQVQERLTAQVADCICEQLQPKIGSASSR